MVLSKKKLFLLVFSVIFLIYIFIIEPNMLEVIYINKTDSEKIRIVFFADLHMYYYFDFHKRLVEKVRSLEPDLIIFGGDALSYKTNVKDLEKFFTDVEKIAPVYTIFGNWEEHAPYHMRERYENLGIFLIENSSVEIEIKNKKLLLTGTESHYYFSRMEFPDSDEFLTKLLIVHAPNKLENYSDIITKYDYVLCGHTHGGQFYLPFISKKISETLSGTSYKFFRGLYTMNDTEIFVSKGVGQWFPGRLFSIPDIGVIDIPLK